MFENIAVVLRQDEEELQTEELVHLFKPNGCRQLARLVFMKKVIIFALRSLVLNGDFPS